MPTSTVERVIWGKLESFRPLVIHSWLRLNDPLFLWSESSVLMSTLVMTRDEFPSHLSRGLSKKKTYPLPI